MTLGMAPESKYLVEPSGFKPFTVRSPATKLWFVHGSVPELAFHNGVRAAIKESGANGMMIDINGAILALCRALAKVVKAFWVARDGVPPPLIRTRLTQSLTTLLPLNGYVVP